jgi:hypothetical protein
VQPGNEEPSPILCGRLQRAPFRGKFRMSPLPPSNPKTKPEKKLIRLVSALYDLSQSVAATRAILAGAPEVLFDHLFLSMVVSYGRPFLESNGAGCVLVDYPGFPDFGDDEMPMRHRRMMDLRNNFLAHSSTEGTRVQIVPPGVPNPLGASHNPNLTSISARGAFQTYTISNGYLRFPWHSRSAYIRMSPRYCARYTGDDEPILTAYLNLRQGTRNSVGRESAPTRNGGELS